jgi:4a-hydroxytetrahydrobiopterin dehydratase
MWKETKQGLHRQFEFIDFAQAFEFMTRVAGIADGVQHHPRWTNEYNKVEIWLNTHSAGGKITAKDRNLAAAIDQVYSEFIQ